jgi:hypothetical protein
VTTHVWSPSTMPPQMSSGSWRRSKKQLALPCRTRLCDFRHLMLLFPFVLSNLFRKEVDEHNSHHQGAPVIELSEDLIGVTNVFLQWYKLSRQTSPAKTPADIGILRRICASSLRGIYYCLHYTSLHYVHYAYFLRYAYHWPVKRFILSNTVTWT